jgi:NADH-quinone oxidoreductase subunit N
MNIISLVSVVSEYFLGTAVLLFLTISIFSAYKVFEFQSALGKAFILSLIAVFILSIIGLGSNSEMYISFVTCHPLLIFFKQPEGMLYKYLGFNFSISQDNLNIVVKSTIYFFSIIYLFLISDFLKDQNITSFEYYIVFLFALLGLIVLCSSNDLLISYVSIELSSIAFYILAAFRKKLTYSVDAGIKYFITGAMSSGFFLLGTSLIYALEGSINFSDFLIVAMPHKTYFENSFALIPSANTLITNIFYEVPKIEYYPPLPYLQEIQWLFLYDINNYFFVDKELFRSLEFGLSLILFSLFIKLGLAPFHLWSIDVYEGAPTSSTIFFAVITKISVFVLIIRLFSISFVEFFNIWQPYFVGVGLMSVFIGTFGGIVQRRVKILLAYSSVSNMGFALILLSSKGDFAVWFTVIYLIVYMTASFSVWSAIFILKLENQYGNRYSKDLSDFGLFKKSNPTLAYCFSVALFSLAGTPPLIGFISKLAFFMSVLFEYSITVSLMLILFSVVSAFYYIRIVKCMFFENSLTGRLFKPLYLMQTSLFGVITLLFIFVFGHPSSMIFVGSLASPLVDSICTKTF